MNIQDLINSVYNSDDSTDNIMNPDLSKEADSNDVVESVINKSEKETTEDDVFSLDISSLQLKMLGYYDEEGQYMKEEEKYPNEAIKLASLLKKSFGDLSDIPKNNDTQDFLDAYQGRAVFLFRDKKYSLYAYWPCMNIVRLSNVSFVQSNITQVPFYLKYWFVPGEPFTTKKNVTERKTLFDYLSYSLDREEQVSLNVFGKSSIKGVVSKVGTDFLVLTSVDRNEYIVSNNIMITRGPALKQDFSTEDFQSSEDDNDLQANGHISKININGGAIFDYSSRKLLNFSFHYNKHLEVNHLNEVIHLNVNDKVIFDLTKKGTENLVSICPTKFNEALKMCKLCLESKDIFIKKQENLF